MVQINFAQKTVNVKIVYYGPGMSGKTTNLEVVHQRAPDTNRGELTSISTDGDRTLFFDYMPLELGTVAGMRTCFQLYTVPGQVYYNSTRKLVLQGVDGVIFVADSSSGMIEQNLESLNNLEENLNEYGKSLATLPHVLQWNKRDLPDAMPVEELERLMNRHKAPTFEGIANTGQGVFPTLKALAASVLKTIMQESGGMKTASAGEAAPAAAVPTAAAPAAPPVQPVGSTPGNAGFGGGPSYEQASGAGAAPAATPPSAAKPELELRTTRRDLGGGLPSTARAGALMGSQPKAAPARSRKASRRPAAGAQRRPRPATTGSTVAIAPKKKRRSGASTGLFVAIAAGIGAAIAYGVLTLL